MALSESFSSGGKSTRCNSPRMRKMGGFPVERCRSEALCSNIRLKNASILAIQALPNSKSDTEHPKSRHMSQIRDILRQEIEAHGPISCAQFMSVALYCPKIGYYERQPAVIGSGGDFYTSASLGPVFGQLLAWQFAEWSEQFGPGPITW